MLFWTTGTLALSLETQAAAETLDPIKALGIYPADIRAATAEVLQHPDVLLKLEKFREKSRAEFKNLISPYPQKTQETVWQLVPYRKLWRGLGANLGSEEATEELLKSYPKDIRDRANYLLKNNPDIIGKVVAMEKKTYQQFFQMISGMDPQAQAAFRTVGQRSGIFSVLSKALNLSSGGTEPTPELKQKSQNLANELLALNKGGKPAGPTANVNSSDASAILSAESKKFNEAADSQMDQDPYTEGATQVNVDFGYEGRYYPSYPYWYGTPYLQ
jgi:hypothetical protein